MQVAAVSPRAWLLFALALGFFVTTSPAGAVDIIELHQNNYQGVPAGSYPVGTPVTISGVVSSATASRSTARSTTTAA